MKKTLVILFSFFYVSSFAQTATGNQTFKFRSRVKDTEYNVKYNESSMGRNNLGEDIALKVYVIKKNYTYIEPATPTSPSPRTVIKKPIIYSAMNKLVKAYEKEVKKNLIPKEKAATNLNRDLDIIYSVANANTSDLEAALRGKSKRQEIEEVLSRVVLE